MTDETGIVVLLALVFFVLFLVAQSRSKRNEKLLNESSQKLKKALDNLATQKQQIEQLERELYDKQLENLKFVLNPHSVRNTLNTIHGLAQKTFNSVVGLSSVFDYMLYVSQEKFVRLDQELKFAREYVELYKMRLSPLVSTTIYLDMNNHSDFGGSKYIAPLITASFIENAFKHGDMESSDSFLDVRLEISRPSTIIYSVRNKMKEHIQPTQMGGLGQKKMKERLDLLYPGNYSMDCSSSNGVFSANLKLNLHEQETALRPR